ncbi:PgaD [Syntrophotalea carbinolica DSM 2380]|uniref:PgaD n=1 Tax=Syntrophotalea carbinolica (strain DSM 2380 / NBRC 103641 / GraBd1) TaxID=338963 RepID=Q3A0T3_SYNC1|nr:poly-beta-1,6-N-acetyl-D-glucosamine biosynthesis protein PgaD [Syntrophotalea carbinolica]ABA90024.1 PgaD [Syntrophotalea carbinolica DSM 2380]
MGDNLIIEKPEAQNRGQRLAQGVLTVGFWCLFLSLLRPLLTLFAWLIGIRLFTYEMIEKDGGRLLLEALRNYGLVVLVLAVILRTWAWYNHRRFAGREKRRNTMPPLSTDEITGYYGVDPTALAMWRKDGSLYVRHNKEGKVLEVQTAQPPPWGDCACSVSLSRAVSPEGDDANSPPPCAP